MNVLFVVAMGLGFLGLVLFFQLFKPGFIWGGGDLLFFCLFGGRGWGFVCVWVFLLVFFFNHVNVRPWKYLSLFAEV